MMKPASPKIAIVAASAPPFSSGGVASAHYNLFRALKGRGFAVKLFTFFDNGISENRGGAIVRCGASPRLVNVIYRLAQLPFRIIQPGKLAYQSATIFRSAIGAFKMGRAIRRFDPDVVILSDHGAPGLFVPKKPGQRFVLISHHNPARFANEPLLGDYSQLDARLAIWLEQFVFKKVDQVICPSRYIAKWFHKTYSFEGSVRVLPNLIDLHLIDSIKSKDVRKEMNLPKNAIIIYLPSAGTLIKGSSFLTEIIEGLFQMARRRIGLYIPGHVEELMAQRLKADPRARSLYLPGQLTYAEHIAIVKSCSFGITPAIMENFSMAILEAAYSGVPMLAFRRGGNEDIIENGKNGYLFQAFQVSEMLEMAMRLMKGGRVQALKKRTKSFTRQKFKSDVVLEQYLQAFGIN